MVPVLAVGFDDLRQRVDGQMRQATEQQKALMVWSFLTLGKTSLLMKRNPGTKKATRIVVRET
jgi:hypothetical protein